MTGQVGVGLLQLGVHRRAAAMLELELLVDQPRALDYLVVPVGALALDRVDDRGLLLGVGQAGAKDLAVAALRAQSGHQPRRGARGLRRRRDLVSGLADSHAQLRFVIVTHNMRQAARLPT